MPWPAIAASSASDMLLKVSPAAAGTFFTPDALSHIGQVGTNGSRSAA
jgi:hypothetical protein